MVLLMKMMLLLDGLFPQEAVILLWVVACALVAGVVFFFRFPGWPCENDVRPLMHCSPLCAMRIRNDLLLLPGIHSAGLFSLDGSQVDPVYLC